MYSNNVPATICGQSTYWYVPPPKAGVIDPLFIAAGPKRSSGLFHIKKINDALGGYKIVFCPNDSDCSDIGIFVDRHGVRRLALSSTPFPVVFMKASGTEALPKTMSIV
ncbi:kunitz trypsin inhibitor 4-like [Brassica rapa]|uniref:kunitz trypsin inhibitor 4-like n=1 Tax=Brassica campestris TaxID=3711 RepID=UPI0004F15B95|nr:kunitz trypsin inhibitor 4-like [Brassica rapa]